MAALFSQIQLYAKHLLRIYGSFERVYYIRFFVENRLRHLVSIVRFGRIATSRFTICFRDFMLDAST